MFFHVFLYGKRDLDQKMLLWQLRGLFFHKMLLWQLRREVVDLPARATATFFCENEPRGCHSHFFRGTGTASGRGMFTGL